MWCIPWTDRCLWKHYLPTTTILGSNYWIICQIGNRALPQSPSIYMRTYKAHATRLPPSGHLPSGYLPQAFEKARPKRASQHCDYQLPDHLYISLSITSIKAPMSVTSYNRLVVIITTLLISTIYFLRLIAVYNMFTSSRVFRIQYKVANDNVGI